MKTTKATKSAATAMNSIVAQSGAITVQVKTRSKTSAKKLKEVAPLATAMLAINEETTVELLSRLPRDTVAFQVFSSHAMSTASLFAWFDENQARLTRKTKEGKTLLNVAGAYCAAFDIEHNKARDGALKAYPFYKRFSNALQQWAIRRGGVEKRASGSVTDAIASYLDKKAKEDIKALEDSLVAWVLKHEDVLNRIINSKAV